MTAACRAVHVEIRRYMFLLDIQAKCSSPGHTMRLARDCFKHLESTFTGARSRLRTGVSQCFVYILKVYLSHFSLIATWCFSDTMCRAQNVNVESESRPWGAHGIVFNLGPRPVVLCFSGDFMELAVSMYSRVFAYLFKNKWHQWQQKRVFCLKNHS